MDTRTRVWTFVAAPEMCFPAAATLLVRDVATSSVVSKSMAELVPGDLAQVLTYDATTSYHLSI